MSILVDQPTGTAESVQLEPVTQAMLQEYDRLIEASKRRITLRLEIMQRLDAGAVIEDGPLAASIREYDDFRFTHPKLVEVLGETRVAELKSKMKATLIRQLIVHPAQEVEELALES